MLRLSRDQLREIDRISIEEYGLPGIVLMENAARSAVQVISSHNLGDGTRKAVVLCGGGNNGGDGFAVARLLHNDGWSVSIVALKPLQALQGDAAIMAGVATRMDIPIWPDFASAPHLTEGIIIDAITGTGLSRPLDGAAALAAKAIAAAGRVVVALDLPSGMNCETGEPLSDDCIRAVLTITFAAEKLGFSNPRARDFTGEIVVGGIGCPAEIIQRVARA